MTVHSEPVRWAVLFLHVAPPGDFKDKTVAHAEWHFKLACCFRAAQGCRQSRRPPLTEKQNAESKPLAHARLPSAASVELLCFPPLQLDSNVERFAFTFALYHVRQGLSIPQFPDLYPLLGKRNARPLRCFDRCDPTKTGRSLAHTIIHGLVGHCQPLQIRMRVSSNFHSLACSEIRSCVFGCFALQWQQVHRTHHRRRWSAPSRHITTDRRRRAAVCCWTVLHELTWSCQVLLDRAGWALMLWPWGGEI
jgi:hypothetical protein